MSKEKFLSNMQKKDKLVESLIEELRTSNFETNQVIDDADAEIVKRALQASK